MREDAVDTPLAMSEVREILTPLLVANGEQAALSYLSAMVALENGNGEKIVDYNWGNITTDDPSDAYFQKGSNPRKFNAFSSHVEGASKFLERLNSVTHRRILEAALLNDFVGFIQAIHTESPQTGMAYNPLTGGKLAQARYSYAQLIRKYGGIAPKLLAPKKTDASGLAVVFLLVAIVGSYYVSTQPHLKKFFQ